MGEVKPRPSGDGSTTIYPNPYAKTTVVVLLCGGLLSGLYVGWQFLTVYNPLDVVSLLVPAISVWIVFMLLADLNSFIPWVGIGKTYVMVRLLHKLKRIERRDVLRIVLDPPIESDSLEYRYWTRPSLCTIHFADGKRFEIMHVPDGIKLRVARVLDPENFPPAEQQD